MLKTLNGFIKNFSRLARDSSGATAIEYGLIGAGVALIIVASIGNIGTGLKSTFANVNAGLDQGSGVVFTPPPSGGVCAGYDINGNLIVYAC